MKIIRSIPTAFLISVLISSVAAASTCDERSGVAYIQNKNLDAAYKALRGCEKKKDASAEALTSLAILYGSLDYGDLTEDEALKTVWRLLHRAAALGHTGALESVIRLYRDGEPKLLVSPNIEKQRCLERLAYSGGNQDENGFGMCIAGQL